MSPSVDIKTPSPRSMKSSLDEAGPPSPIDLDTPEEDKEEQEEKKKKKKKKKREDGQDVSQPVQMDVNKEKTKRKRRMEDEGSEVMEREKKRKKGGEGVEEDVVKEGEEKKRKKKKKNLEEEIIVEVIVVKEGGKKKKKKEKKNNLEEVIEVVEEIMVKEGGKKKEKKEKNNNLEEEVIEVVEEIMVKEGGKKKKKKEKKNNLEEEVIEVVEEVVVKEGGEKKKKKKKLGEETIEGVEEDVVNGGEEKKKKKKKKVVDQPIEAVEENVVNEGGEKKKKKKKKVVDQTIEENAVNEGGEKKKKKKKEVVDQTIEAIEENAVNEGGEKKKKKKKKVVEETIERVEENVVNEGGEKKKKKKKKVVEETIERAEENVVNKGGEKKKKKKKIKTEKGGGEELPESRGGVVELDGEKKKTGTTQEAKKKKKKKRVTSDGKREGGEKAENRGRYKIDHTSRLEDLLEEPDVKEILEYFPRVRSRAVIERLRRYDLHRFREFKKQGISLRRGRCTAEEKRQIRTNVNDFLVLTGITSAQDLFFPHRCKERSTEIKKLRTQHRFMEKMGEGLHRSCFQVYSLAKKMTDELNHLGRFDDEEIHMLQRLQTRHGNDWREIAKSMDRSVESLQKRFAHIASNHGVWESDEEGRLKQAMLAHLETLVGPEQTGSASGPWLTSEQLCKNLPWKSISEKVQTRCWSQCREKWFGLLKSKMASDHCPAFSGGVKAIQAKVKLINTLYNMDVEDPALIEWDEVAITIGEVSERYVQKSFHRLKVASVPRWNELSYPDIIDFLQDKVVPKLEEHLKEAGDTDLPCQEKYFLSHICSSGEVDSGIDI